MSTEVEIQRTGVIDQVVQEILANSSRFFRCAISSVCYERW
jgi:hypothetical protein